MYLIRQANLDDVKAIREIAEETWWAAYLPILEKEQIRFMLDELYAGDVLRNQIKHGVQTYLLLLEDSTPVAFAAYSPGPENADVYKLHKLYCLPQTQGKGFGRVLIDEVAAKALAAGSNVLELNVNRRNKAKAFYERVGFSVASEEDIPIGNYWMNDYVMRKNL